MAMSELVDPSYGAIFVHWNDDGSECTVSGESIPTASITRIGIPAERSDVPIGTRDPEHLTLTLDGKEFDVRPSRGRLSRRSYRVFVDGPEHSWLYTPASSVAHRLVQGSRYNGNNEIGMFTAVDNDVAAEWSEEVRFAGAVARAVDSTPLDCALGYLLAVAFETGAQIMVVAIVTGVVDAAIPG